MTPFRVFVTGTDTGIGKTEVGCALLSLLADAGRNPAPFKPYETGIRAGGLPADAVALREAARSDDDLQLICPHRYREPLAPGVAGQRLGTQAPFPATMRAFRAFAARSLVAESAGGLRVPIDDRRDNLDLIAATKLPVILVARAGLGTLNHTALSIDALRARHIPILGVVLVRSGPVKDLSEQDNAAVVARRHRVRVLGPIPFVRDGARRRAAFRNALGPLLAQ